MGKVDNKGYLNNLCNNLNRLIKKSGISKTQISNALGITHNTLNNWLKCETVIDGISLYRLADILSVTVEDLFQNDNGINLKFLPFHENVLDT